jgi:Ca2+-binding RTX toxin-like protein
MTTDSRDDDDVLRTSAGQDTLEGEDGDDTFEVRDGFGDGTSILGGAAAQTTGDTLDLSATTTGVTLDLTSADAEDGSFSDGAATATFVEIENIILGGGRDTVVLADGSGADAVQAFDMTDSGDGTTNDQLDVSGLTSDGGTTPVTTADVTVTANGDGDAVLTFTGGESITLVGVTPSQVDTTDELVAIGIPRPALDYIVEGTSGGDLINAGYTGDPEGDMVDALDHSDGSNDDSIEAYGGNDTIFSGLGDDTIYVGSGDDRASASAGNDIIFGESGANTLFGEAGDDTIVGGSDGDFIRGGTDADSLTGNAGSDTIYGEAGNDYVDGGDQNDSLYGDGGDDTLYGGSGNDSILGGNEADLAFGGIGADTLRGGNHSDTLHGDAGADSLFGDAGGDLIFAGSENDTVFGGNHDDTVYAGTGNDSVLGEDGNDTLSGEEGADTIEGGDGGDLIHGGDGGDTIYGDTNGDTIDAGSDTIYGGTGNDSIDAGLSDDIVIAGDGADTVQGGAGNDMIFGDEPLSVSYNAGAAQGSGSGGSSISNLTDFPTDTFTVELQFNGDAMSTPGPTITDPITTTLFSYGTASSPSEVVVYAVSDNEIYDLSTPMDLTDTIVEPGYLTVDVNGNSYTTSILSSTVLDGSDHSVAITFDAAAQEVVLFIDGSPAETIALIDDTPIETGGTFTIGQGPGSLGGFAGEIFDARLWDDIRTDGEISQYNSGTLEEEAGDPDLISNWVPDPFSGGLRDDVGGNGLTSTGGSTVTTQPGFGDDSLSGGDGSDTIYGSGGNDTLDGDGVDTLGGADFLDGGDGDDLIRGDVGNDTLYGRDGSDTMEGGDGNDWLGGGAGADDIDGGIGNDTLFGNDVSDADTLLGGDDRDLIFATKNDSVDGGAGGDDWDILSVGGMSVGGSVNYVETGVDSNGNGVDGYIEFFDSGGVLEGRLDFEEIEEFTGIICFTKGARILTASGTRPIETLRVGDLVHTRDNGLQPIRWIGDRTVSGTGSLAPISFEINALETATRPLLVSPQHRMLFTGYEAELLFGQREVLVPAKHLINGTTIKQAVCDEVNYIHVMFDAHEVIYADGQATESFHAADCGLDVIADASREELFNVFPELRWNTGAHGDTARTCLKAHEAGMFAKFAETRAQM